MAPLAPLERDVGRQRAVEHRCDDTEQLPFLGGGDGVGSNGCEHGAEYPLFVAGPNARECGERGVEPLQVARAGGRGEGGVGRLETRAEQLQAVNEFFAQLADRGQRLTYAEELAA